MDKYSPSEMRIIVIYDDENRKISKNLLTKPMIKKKSINTLKMQKSTPPTPIQYLPIKLIHGFRSGCSSS